MPRMPSRRVISITFSRPTANESSAATVFSDFASAIHSGMRAPLPCPPP